MPETTGPEPVSGTIAARTPHAANGVGETRAAEAFPWAAGAHGACLEDADGKTYRDLTSAAGACLLGFDHPAVRQAVEAACDRAAGPADTKTLTADVVAALRDAFGGAERVLLTTSAGAALDVARAVVLRRAGREGRKAGGNGRNTLLDLRERPLPDARAVSLLAADAVATATVALCSGQVAAVVLEPTAPDAAGAARLAAIAAKARERGVPIVCDESQSAFRLASAGAATALLAGVRPEATIVGESIAAGLPFGAVLGDAALLDLAPHGGDGPRAVGAARGGHAVALAAARATLRVLQYTPVAAAIASAGERVRLVFEEGCAREQLRGHLRGPPGRMTLSFEAQENADAELIRSVFLEELMRQGIVAGAVWMPNAATAEDDLQHLEAGIRSALRRLRTLLIEHNSWLSGGLPWPFLVRASRAGEPAASPTPSGAPQEAPPLPAGHDRARVERVLAGRGLAVYRYPARAAVDVRPALHGMRIAFARGDLGPVTSSGFWVPTRLRGDFAVRLAYRLEQWAPGASANLGLFAQDELSLVRYYAQRSSSGGERPHHVVLAHLAERLSPHVPITGNEGELALARRGGAVSSWHRERGGEWVLLDRHEETESRDMIVGCKIWSSETCGGLVADVTELHIDNDLPADQIAPLPIRPDPRGGRI